jgi:septum formation protein
LSTRRLVLASTSPYRRSLLESLGLRFECLPPGVNEHPRPGEDGAHLVRRLAHAKAGAGARARPDALVIGSDQLALRDGAILGKPLEHAAAVAQLQASAGRELRFLTAVCLVDAASGATQSHVDETLVRMRALTTEEIERYLAREPAYDTAGSFKVEGLGIALFDWIRSEDPTALQGLPLIWLCSALARAGLPVV